MNKPDILDYVLLHKTRLIKLEANLKKAVGPDTPIQAQVELGFSPQIGEEQQAGYFLLAQLKLKATTNQQDKDELLNCRCQIEAEYRLLPDKSLTREDFAESHATLARQLYPLIQSRLMPILKDMGFDKLVLPADVITKRMSTDKPQNVVLH